MPSCQIARDVTTSREMREVVDEALSLGYDVEQSNGGHLKFTHPDVPTPVFASQTPSDARGPKRALGDLRRYHRQATNPTGSGQPAPESPEPESQQAAYDCSACRGQGSPQGFDTAQELADHMGEAHPAPALPQPDATQKETSMETKDDTAPTTPKPREARGQEDFSKDDLLLFCQMSEGEFTIADIIDMCGFLDTPKTRSVIHNRLSALLKSPQYPLERPRKGHYLWATGDDPSTDNTTTTDAPATDAAPDDTAPDDTGTAEVDDSTAEDTMPATATAPAPAPTETAPETVPVAADTVEVAPGATITCVVEAKDGRMIVKDDTGRVFMARFETI
jgi:hypothetical protein